jgi:hypothetical protein
MFGRPCRREEILCEYSWQCEEICVSGTVLLTWARAEAVVDKSIDATTKISLFVNLQMCERSISVAGRQTCDLRRIP